MKMKRLILLVALSMAACQGQQSQICNEDCPKEVDHVARILEDRSLAASNLYYYDYEPSCDTRPPKGYKPFYISHYGRHGSRYMDSGSEIGHVRPVMEMADSLGILTETGKSFYKDLMAIIHEQEGIVGMLTERGASELRGMGERMPERFPDVFSGNDGREKVNFISSSSARCIISMTNFFHTFSEKVDDLDFDFITGEKYYQILAYHPPVQEGLILSRDMEVAFRRAECNPEMLLGEFFTDLSVVEEAVGDMYEFERRLYQLCCVGHLTSYGKNLFDYFPEESLIKNWQARNARFYVAYAISKELPDYAPKVTAPLLEDIIERADAALASDSEVAADLRFGHDLTLMPLLSHLGIEGMHEVLSFDEVNQNWNSSDFINMGANLQMVFYRNRQGDVLVKLLHNERETTIPALDTFHGPYYSWPVFRDYLMGLLHPVGADFS